MGKVLVAVATFAGWVMLGAFAGYLFGQFAPGGLAALAEPGSPLRDAEARHYAIIGGIVGFLLRGLVELLVARQGGQAK